MKTTLAAILFLLSLATLPHGEASSQQPGAPEPPAEVSLTYMGCAGWQISHGKTTILVDPYLSRIRHAQYGPPAAPTDTRRAYTDEDLAAPDTRQIDARIKRADYVLVHHSHFDHALDVPYIARKTGAAIVGHESTANLMRAHGIADERLITVRGGEDYEFGDFSLRVIPSLHSALDNKRYHDPLPIPRGLRAPLKLGQYAEGGSLSYLIRIGGVQILTMGSMNYIEREMEGLRPDVALVGANRARLQIHDYTGRLMRALGGPRLVIPTHWDNYFAPYDSSQEQWLAHVRVFVEEVERASPNTETVVPRYFEPIIVRPRRR